MVGDDAGDEVHRGVEGLRGRSGDEDVAVLEAIQILRAGEDAGGAFDDTSARACSKPVSTPGR